MIKTASVIGARPQFIKYSPLARAIETHNRSGKNKIEEILIHSGQHYDYEMSDIFFKELGIPGPGYHLNVGSGSPAFQTGSILQKCEDVFLKEKPGLALVFGDTNTTLGAALAAVKLHIPVIHIEAGLRSFNRLMQEEINRVLVDHIASFLLCPSTLAVSNLQKEGFGDEKDYSSLGSVTSAPQVINIGDIMYDALLFSLGLAEKKSTVLEKNRLKKGDYHLLTMHRAENIGNPSRMKALGAFLNRTTGEKTVIFPMHPHTERVFEETEMKLADHIRVIEPVGYYDMLTLLKNSDMLFTDSGGMQKEAFWLKIPCVTLRDETEWVETLENGWNVLYKDYNGRHDFKMRDECPYGDGNAAGRILKIIEQISEMR